MAPAPSEGRKEMMASSMVRTPQAGCQLSSWCAEMDRQILVPTSKRPLRVKKTMLGGFMGYSEGKRMRPW